VAELEHVSDLSRWRDVRNPEVVAIAIVDANGNAMFIAGMVAPTAGAR
jgi:hypothetical protein